jgi:hypothetical protein
VETSTARQQLGKHVPVATKVHTIIEELLEDVFSMQSIEKLYSLLPTVPLLLKAGVA